jgi:hypothetical protein
VKPGALVLLALLGSCAAPAPEPERSAGSADVHPRFADLRPVMLQLRVDGDGEGAAELREGLYRGLIEKGYSVLAPGAPAGSEVGIFRARIDGEGASRTGTASLEDPFGTVLYRFDAPLVAADPAARILERLPPK